MSKRLLTITKVLALLAALAVIALAFSCKQEVKTFKVTLVSDGEETPLEVRAGSLFQIPERTKTGYRFMNVTDPSGKFLYLGESITVNSDMTLTYNWEANTYKVKYNTAGGTLSERAPGTTIYGEELCIPSVTAPAGHHAGSPNVTQKDTTHSFAAGDCVTVDETNFDLPESVDTITLTYNWEPYNYHLVFDLTGLPSTATLGDADLPMNPVYMTYEDSYKPLPPGNYEGYHLENITCSWVSDGVEKTRDFNYEDPLVLVFKDLSPLPDNNSTIKLTYNWEINKYKVYVISNNGKIINNTPVDYDGTYALMTLTFTGHHIASIKDGGGNDYLGKASIEHVKSDLTLTYNWEPDTYHVEFNVTGTPPTVSPKDAGLPDPFDANYESSYELPSANCEGHPAENIICSWKSDGKEYKKDFNKGSQLVFNDLSPLPDNDSVITLTYHWKRTPSPESEFELQNIGEGEEEDEVEIKKYNGPDGVVIIPSSINGKKVASIGAWAFYNRSGLTSISIPDSVTSIGSFAFSGCTGLTSIYIPPSVTSIANDVFYECWSLKEISISNGVTKIGHAAFKGCIGLTEITIPRSVTSIEYWAFQDCKNLLTINICKSKADVESQWDKDWHYDCHANIVYDYNPLT